MKNCRLPNIINLKRHLRKDSAYQCALKTEARYADRRVARQFKINEKATSQGENRVRKTIKREIQ